jgi:transcription elongation factor Elf1
MKIKEIISQYRRDFKAVYECEGCGHTEVKDGYDDRNFHDNVIPAMKCKNCNKSRNDMDIIEKPTATKYPEHMRI